MADERPEPAPDGGPATPAPLSRRARRLQEAAEQPPAAPAPPGARPASPYGGGAGTPYGAAAYPPYQAPPPPAVHPEPGLHPDPALSAPPGYPLPGYPPPGFPPVGHPLDGHPPERDEDARHGRLHAIGLPLAGVLLLAWALTALVGDVHWGPLSVLPVGLACLSPLVLLVALPLALLGIQRRRWASLVPAAVAAVLPWSFVVGYALPADPAAGPAVALRAMLVTAHDGQADAQDVAAAVRSQGADLLVVTELSAALAHDLALAGLPAGMVPRWVSVPEPGASPLGGIGIYSRFPVDRATPLRGTRLPAVVVRVTVGRTPVTLVAGHAVQPSTDHLDRWRHDLESFRTAESVRGPVLVLANLNATPWNPQFRWVVSGRLHDAADVLGRGLRPTWPTWSPFPLLATDHVLVAGIGVTDVNALAIAGSDHRALSVGLQIPTR